MGVQCRVQPLESSLPVFTTAVEARGGATLKGVSGAVTGSPVKTAWPERRGQRRPSGRWELGEDGEEGGGGGESGRRKSAGEVYRGGASGALRRDGRLTSQSC